MKRILLSVGLVLMTFGFLGQVMLWGSSRVNILNPDPLVGYDWVIDQIYTGSEFTHKIGILGFYTDNKFSLSIYDSKDLGKKELERKGTYSFNRTIQSNALILDSDHGKQLFRYSINDNGKQLILHEIMEDSFGDKRIPVIWILKR